MEERLEHVEVSLADLSAVNHVECLQEHEDVEDVSEMPCLRLRLDVESICGGDSACCDSFEETTWH